MKANPPQALIYGLFIASGATGLIYESVWVRELVLVFGGSTYAITTVLVAFMAGLALGSYVAGRFSSRIRRAGQAYGLLEIFIGLYALLVPTLLVAAQPMYRAMYPHVMDMPWLLTGARFLIGGFVILLPATAMGATLPILVRYVTGPGRAFGRSVGQLYGVNALGAVCGALATGFVLIPTFGLSQTTHFAAAANLLIGVVAMLLLRPAREERVHRESPGRRPSRAADVPVVAITPAVRRFVLIGFACSGLAAMVYQIAWTRALVLSLGSSTYSFTCILAAFILGLAVGSLATARWVDGWRNPVRVFGALQLAIGLAAVVIVPIYDQLPSWMYEIISRQHARHGLLLFTEFLLIIALTLVPTALMGAIFPLVTRIVATGQRDAGAATGQAYSINAVGTIVGAFLAGFVLIRSDVLGVQNSIVAAAALNGLVGALAMFLAPAGAAPIGRRVLVPSAALLLLLGLGFGMSGWDRNMLTSGPFAGLEDPRAAREKYKIRYFAEGPDITVAVKQTPSDPDALFMSVNGKVDASTGFQDMTTQILLAHLPALLSPGERSACVIGLGSGITLGSLARHASFERIDCIEISGEVVKAAAYFAPFNYDVLERNDPRVHLYRGDGRNHLLLSDHKYDLITSEPSNPWIAGVSNLFTREFFELCQARLTDEGRLCVWLHAYRISYDDFRMVVRTLHEVFDDVSVWETDADYLMLASRSSSPLPLESIVDRMRQPGVKHDLFRIGQAQAGELLGRYVTSGGALREWAASAPVHTDDNALLEFSAPRHMYRNDELKIARALAERQDSVFERVVKPAADPSLQGEIQGQVAAVVEARASRFESLRLTARRDPIGALRAMLRGLRSNPGNPQLYRLVRLQRRDLEAGSPRLANLPETQTLFEQVDRSPAPTFLRRSDVPVSEILSELTDAAEQAAQRTHWAIAAEHLHRALQLAPQADGVSVSYASMLVNDGRVDEAVAQLDALLARNPEHGPANFVRGKLAVLRNELETSLVHLDKALASGRFRPADLEKDPVLQRVREDAGFRALLERYAESDATPRTP
ncbi:MAG: fused MFS/spermidine synthase [Planctomycetes bacterium]|nr:fused MFS/spermidine synthase [Planctomycetota bacterium]